MNHNIADIVQKALSQEIEKIIAEEAVEAGKRAEKRVREATVIMASTVLKRFSLEPYGRDGLKIVVSFEDQSPNG